MATHSGMDRLCTAAGASGAAGAAKPLAVSSVTSFGELAAMLQTQASKGLGRDADYAGCVRFIAPPEARARRSLCSRCTAILARHLRRRLQCRRRRRHPLRRRCARLRCLGAPTAAWR